MCLPTKTDQSDSPGSPARSMLGIGALMLLACLAGPALAGAIGALGVGVLVGAGGAIFAQRVREPADRRQFRVDPVRRSCNSASAASTSAPSRSIRETASERSAGISSAARLSPMRSANSRCCAPSCRSPAIRRRSASAACSARPRQESTPAGGPAGSPTGPASSAPSSPLSSPGHTTFDCYPDLVHRSTRSSTAVRCLSGRQFLSSVVDRRGSSIARNRGRDVCGAVCCGCAPTERRGHVRTPTLAGRGRS